MPIEDELAALRPDLRKLISIIIRADDDVVDDLTQEVLMHCFSLVHKYDPTRCSLKTWAQIVARNDVLHYMRGAKTNEANFIRLTETGELQDVVGEVMVPEVEIDDKQAQLIALLHKYIDKLTEPQRQVLNMYYMQDKTDREIAQEIHISLDGVTQRRHRAINRLKGLMAKRAG